MQRLLAVVLVAVCGGAALGGGTAQPQLPASPQVTCGDLASNGTFESSYEGSWTYYGYDTAKTPLGIDSIGYMTFSDWGERGQPFWADVLRVKLQAAAPRAGTTPPPHSRSAAGVNGTAPAACTVDSYLWRPDFVTMRGGCGPGVALTVEIAFQSNATVCTRYNISAAGTPGSAGTGSATLEFGGLVPPDIGSKRVARLSAHGGAALLHTTMNVSYGTPTASPLDLDRWWVVQNTAGSPVTLSPNLTAYGWTVAVAAGASTSVGFCVTELEAAPTGPPAPRRYDPANTTASVNGWLAELRPLAGGAAANLTLQYYTAWFQFWYNTEHGAGYWSRPIITPSMSHYGRGMWLWDTGFHVMALLTGGTGPRALQKALDQLTVMVEVGAASGHIPRVIGPSGIELTTQPPGILTWASLVVFNKTRDRGFLAKAYLAFSQNNAWFYAQRGDARGLCQWEGEDSGWDNSVRWDQGIVDAIDLNSWLYLDQLLLARMGAALGKPAGEVQGWEAKAANTSKAIQTHLWDAEAGVFWDRLPVPDAPSCASLKGPLCDCHGGCEATGHRCSCVSCGTCDSCDHCQCCSDGPANATGGFVKVVTPATFWSMLVGVATPAQADSMVAAFLTPDNLLTPYPMPVVGRSEKKFDPNNYWRGPVWVNVNWLSLLGFECYGHDEQARAMRAAVVGEIGRHAVPREYYNPLTDGGLGAFNFMWTGAVQIIIANELDGHAPARDVLHEVAGCPAHRHVH